MRTNVYKQHILKALSEQHLLSMTDIHSRVSDADYSTIYRNVEQLVAAGQLKKLVLGKNDIRYELVAEHGDHDHFFCVDCGDIQVLPGSVRGRFMPELAMCSVSDLLIKGLCQDCNDAS